MPASRILGTSELAAWHKEKGCVRCVVEIRIDGVAQKKEEDLRLSGIYEENLQAEVLEKSLSPTKVINDGV